MSVKHRLTLVVTVHKTILQSTNVCTSLRTCCVMFSATMIAWSKECIPSSSLVLGSHNVDSICAIASSRLHFLKILKRCFLSTDDLLDLFWNMRALRGTLS